MTPPGPPSPPLASTASPQRPLRAFAQILLSLTLLGGALYGISVLTLWLRGPSLTGVSMIATTEATRSDSPLLHEIVRRLHAHEIYTYNDLLIANHIVQSAGTTIDLARLLNLSIGLFTGTGALLIIRTIRSWWTSRRPPIPPRFLVGILSPAGGFIPHALPPPPLDRRPLTKVTDPLIRHLTPMTPLATALLECYAAHTDWPAASQGRHSDTSLLQHTVNVRSTALALAQQRSQPLPLAELAALAHDLGKLVTFRHDGRQWIRTSPLHDRRSAMLLATLPEWQMLSREDQEDLTIAVAYHHHPERSPASASRGAKHLLALLREADGFAVHEETPSHSPTSHQTPSNGQGPSDANHRMPDSGIRSATPPLSPVPNLQQAVADTLKSLLPVLRINTRPFDGQADPAAGLLMLLNHSLRQALASQLSPEHQHALSLNTDPSLPDTTAAETAALHPSTDTITSAFRQLGWLIEQQGDHTATLWDITTGRRRWLATWLLNLNALSPELLTKWGTSSWPIRVIGPHRLPLPPTHDAPLIGTPDTDASDPSLDIPHISDDYEMALGDGLLDLPGEEGMLQ